MPEYRQLSGKEVFNTLCKNGWNHIRTEGSHHIVFKHGSGPPFSIPIHGNKELKVGTLNNIIKSTGLSKEDFYKFFES
ncbi:type II toxin-antitoxin system HicA family toxin [Alicyclobacillus tolerans]|uniref:type II toxin-antitoxin system HicA family toxin n=1 Tax=Alicyclobacillus tolerans TaxID=90970 RepID=UPI003B82292E